MPLEVRSRYHSTPRLINDSDAGKPLVQPYDDPAGELDRALE
jgi:hypothetical protein